MSFARALGCWTWCALAIATMSSPALAAGKDHPKKPAEAAQSKPETRSYYGPQPAAEGIDLTMYSRIREEGLKHSHVMEFAEALMDGIGPRLTGSPNMAKANAWTRDTLTKIGLENAHLEDWGEFGLGWQQENTWVRMVSPDTEPLWAQAAPWSRSTNGPVSGELVYIEQPQMIEKYAGKLKGKIVLLGAQRPTPDVTGNLFSRYTDAQLKEMELATATTRVGGPVNRDALMARLKLSRAGTEAVKKMAAEGVLAILTPSRDAGEGGGTGIIFDDNGADLAQSAQKKENAVAVPNAVMMIEHYNRLVRMLQNHVPVTVEVNIQSRFTGENEHGYDTVAEIPGTDPKLKDQVVMVGGHLDSWISGTGATDNGAGSVVAMEAVRILKSLGVQPRRTIRIALWSGEEQGLYGSAGYVNHHFGTFAEPNPPEPADLPRFLRHKGALTTKPEWETLDAYYNLDNGTGKIRGVYTQENLPIGRIFAQWIAPLKDLGVTTVSYQNTGGTDHLSFDAVGLPGFQFIQDPMDYDTRTHHSDMDTVDRLHPADLAESAVVEAIFLYNTSQRESMMPRKPFPHPEKDTQLSTPIPGIYPNAVEPAK